VRPRIPVWWASLKGLSVRATAEVADGWIPIQFVPDHYRKVWGKDLDAGLAKRDPALGPLQITAGGILAIGEHLVGEERTKVLDFARPTAALYIGGMGARGKNFYNDVCRAYGYEKEATEVQDLYLAGKKKEAMAALPAELLELSNLVGPAGLVKERIAAFREAGVTHLQVMPVGPDPVELVATARKLIDS
jgi:alkanesulfonate monooxygenase SsuD/methylene tetrahydromethanopterin reductase-like flavin-dependent oxidoreductase (luciferase family)